MFTHRDGPIMREGGQLDRELQRKKNPSEASLLSFDKMICTFALSLVQTQARAIRERDYYYFLLDNCHRNPRELALLLYGKILDVLFEHRKPIQRKTR